MNCNYSNSIDYFEIDGVSLFNSRGCNDPSTGYIDQGAMGLTLTVGGTHCYYAEMGTYYYNPQGFAIWIDFNGDGEFSDIEMVVNDKPYCYQGNCFMVPCDAVTGTVKMRTRCLQNSNFSGTDACDDYIYYGWGETEDYEITIAPNFAYTSHPASVIICAGSNASFSASSTASGRGTSYRWQVNDGTGWTNLSNAGVYSGTTTTTLTITAATGTMDGYQYRLLTTKGCTKESNVAVLSVPGNTTVTADPTDLGVCNGANASFTAVVKGKDLTYQWQVDPGTGWANVTNGGIYSNATTATLNITGVSPSIVGYLYRVIATGTCGTKLIDTSAAAEISITPPPSVTTDPANTIVCENENTMLTTAATGSIFGYQWQVDDGSGFADIVDGGIYSGATTDQLEISGAPLSIDNYQYRVIIDGCITPATSAAATLTVNPAIAIASQPSPSASTICPGFDISFTASASGLGINYQWQESNDGGTTWTDLTNTAPYSNVTTGTLDITGAPTSINGYQYRMVASSSVCGPDVISDPVELLISPLTIYSQPVSAIECEGNTAVFSVHAAASGIGYQWEESPDGVTWSALVDGPVYSGVNTDELSIVTDPALDNYRYRCVFTGSCLTPTNSEIVGLTVKTLPRITSNPSDLTVCDGRVTTSSATFTVAATGSHLVYQWQEDNGSGFANISSGGNYINATSATLSISNPTPAFNTRKYRCVVSGYCTPDAISTAATLTVNTRPVITTPPGNSYICSGDNATFTVVAAATGIVYQWQGYDYNTTTWVNLTNTAPYSNVNTATLTIATPSFASNGNNSYRCVISGTCTPPVTTASVYHFMSTPPVIGREPIDAGGCLGGVATFTVAATATTPTGTSNYQWQEDNGSGFVNLSNGGRYSNVNTSTLRISNVIASMNGYLYRVIVSTSCAPPATSKSAKLVTQTLPAISGQPVPLTTCPGIPVTFNVTATASGIQYQWQVNTGSGYVNISTTNPTYAGVSTGSLTITSPVPSMTGYRYRCVVSGYCTPTVTSANVLLTVHNPVSIVSQTIKDTVCETNSKKIGVKASGNALYYQWQIQSSTPGIYTDLLNVPPYSGVNRDSMQVTSAPASLSGSIYRCRITENILCNQFFYSNDIPLFVNPAPVSSPATLTTTEQGIATFSVANTGTNYQWQENAKATGFADLTDPVRYAGFNTNTLTINNVDASMNGNQYRCIVDGMCVNPMASMPSTLIVSNGLGVKKMAWSDINMTVYPNPLSGTQLSISFSKTLKGKTEVKVLDKLGKLVYSGTITPGQNNTASIELQALAAGVYMLQVNNEESNFNQSVRFTKQ